MKDDEKKLTEDQALAAVLEDFTLEHLAEKAKAMSPDELARDLAAQGLPKERVDAIFAKQDARVEQALQADKAKAKATPKVADVLPFRRRFGFGVFVGSGVAASLVLAAGLALFVAGPYVVRDTRTIPTASGAPGTGNPEYLRDRAFEECGRAHWQRCIDIFDQALSIDQPGDKDPDVQAARARATQALLAAKDGGK